jgi:hypothetical protein
MSGNFALQQIAAQPYAVASRVSAVLPTAAILPSVAGCHWSKVRFDATTMGHKPAPPRSPVTSP